MLITEQSKVASSAWSYSTVGWN